jgi:hypothetical protein
MSLKKQETHKEKDTNSELSENDLQKSDQNPLFYHITSSFSQTRKTTSRDTQNVSEISNVNYPNTNYTSLANSKVYHPQDTKSKMLFTFKDDEMMEEASFDTNMDDEQLLEQLEIEKNLELSRLEKKLKKKFKEKEIQDAGPFCTKCRIF